MNSTSSNELATIVICTFNGATRVDDVLSGLAQQSSDSFEVLVVDNASTDETRCRRAFRIHRQTQSGEPNSKNRA